MFGMARERDLQKALKAGRARAGDELFHARRDKSGEIVATLESGGVRLDGRLYPSPSTAARAVAGHAVNGWKWWRLRSSGALLETIRARGANEAATVEPTRTQ